MSTGTLVYSNTFSSHLATSIVFEESAIVFLFVLSYITTASLVLCKQSDFVDDIANKNPSDILLNSS